jgi:hypothetical protein
MPQEQVLQLRAKWATERTQKFQTKLSELLDEMKVEEKADEFILLALAPEPAALAA